MESEPILNPCLLEKYFLNLKFIKSELIMKSQTFLLIVIFFTITFLFHSCTKNDDQIIESEIVFHVPVYKDDGKSESSDVIVYPNPFQNEINISCSFPDDVFAEVQINDQNGEFSIYEIITAGTTRFETEDFPVGVYYIELKKDGYVDRAKLLKINTQ